MANFISIRVSSERVGTFSFTTEATPPSGTLALNTYEDDYHCYLDRTSVIYGYASNFLITDTGGDITAPSISGFDVEWYTIPNDSTNFLYANDALNATLRIKKGNVISISEILSYAKRNLQSIAIYILYARFVGRELIVTYNPNGGTVPRFFDRVRYMGTFPALPTASKGNETTSRWYTEMTGGTEVHQGDTVTQTDDFMLYAHWSTPINTHTLTFDANGGTVSPGSRTIAEGVAFGTLPTPTRSGYTFIEWRTAPYVGTLVTSSTTMGTDDVTIYAIWTGNPLTITLNANGGSVSPTTKSVPNGSTYGNLPRPTRSGFIFDGWWTAATGGTKILATAKPSGSQTVYAHWKQDGGEVVPWVF